jgi:hypothetical protein
MEISMAARTGTSAVENREEQVGRMILTEKLQ